MAMRAIAKKRGDWVDVRALAKHPMESGFRKGKKGKMIPAEFIEVITAKIGTKEIFRGYLGPSVSKDPLVRFYVKANKGDVISISWKDNKKKSEEITTKVR